MTDRKQEDIITIIDSMSNSISDIKSVQQVSGDSFVNYSVYSANTYDFAITLTSIFTGMDFRLTFTHSEPLKYNIVDMSFFMRVDNSNVMANPYVSNAVPYTVQVANEAPQLGVTTWLLNCTNLDFTTWPTVNSHTFYFKFYFNGTVSGTFSSALI